MKVETAAGWKTFVASTCRAAKFTYLSLSQTCCHLAPLPSNVVAAAQYVPPKCKQLAHVEKGDPYLFSDN